jgi:hypothetical protein
MDDDRYEQFVVTSSDKRNISGGRPEVQRNAATVEVAQSAQRVEPIITPSKNNSLLYAPNSSTFSHSALVGKRVYIGFGVAGRKGISVAVPVDMLALIIVAVQTYRAVMATGITFLIADTHALRTGDYDPRAVGRAARRRRHIIFRACEALGVPYPQVFLASEIEHDPLYQALVEEATRLARGDGEYFVRESADIEFFRRVGDVGLKVGWTLASSAKKIGRFDEQAFDRFYLEMFPGGKQLRFVYASPGRTLDPTKPKAAPYLDFENSSRVLLNGREDVRGKLENCPHEATKNAALEYYSAIVDSWEELADYKLDGDTVVEKVENLISMLTARMED